MKMINIEDFDFPAPLNNFCPPKKLEKLEARNLIILNGIYNNLLHALETNLRFQEKTKNYIFLNTPEMMAYSETYARSLHPKHQRMIARHIARQVNDGAKIILTTHSDYIIKELNTLIMLGQKNDHTKSMQKKYGYKDNELLTIDQVILYDVDIKGFKKTEICDQEFGMQAKFMDHEIQEMRDIQEDILYGD